MLHSDETSFNQGTGDTVNEDKKRTWIWVLLTLLVSVFALWLGAQSKAGSNFVANLLTVVTFVEAQRRDVLEFLTQVIRAGRFGQEPPSMLSQSLEDNKSPCGGIAP